MYRIGEISASPYGGYDIQILNALGLVICTLWEPDNRFRPTIEMSLRGRARILIDHLNRV